MDDANVINFPKLCECGCGQPTNLVKETGKRKGLVKGQPNRFLRGHHLGKLEQTPHTVTSEGVFLHLSNGDTCIIAPEDVDLAHIRWNSDSLHYAKHVYCKGLTREKSRIVFLHRMILERIIGRPLQPGEFSDHKNGNPLDNRRENLRAATRQQNMQNRALFKNNTSGYRGVCWIDSDRHAWRAQIYLNAKKIILGYFDTPEEASAVYEQAATEYFGEWKREA